MKNYVKNKRLGFGSVSLRYGHIRNILFAHKDGKNRHFQKTKWDLLSPRMTALEFEAEPHILADTAETNNGSANAGGDPDNPIGDDWFSKPLTYDRSWSADDDEE